MTSMKYKFDVRISRIIGNKGAWYELIVEDKLNGVMVLTMDLTGEQLANMLTGSNAVADGEWSGERVGLVRVPYSFNVAFDRDIRFGQLDAELSNQLVDATFQACVAEYSIDYWVDGELNDPSLYDNPITPYIGDAYNHHRYTYTTNKLFITINGERYVEPTNPHAVYWLANRVALGDGLKKGNK
jgi:hypothetical protein